MLIALIERAITAFQSVPPLYSVEIDKFNGGYADGCHIDLSDLTDNFDPLRSDIDITAILFASLALAPRVFGSVFGQLYKELESGAESKAEVYLVPLQHLIGYLSDRPTYFGYFTEVQLDVIRDIVKYAESEYKCEGRRIDTVFFPPTLNERFGTRRPFGSQFTNCGRAALNRFIATSIHQDDLISVFSERPTFPPVARAAVKALTGKEFVVDVSVPNWLIENQTYEPTFLFEELSRLSATGDGDSSPNDNMPRWIWMVCNHLFIEWPLFLLTDAQLTYMIRVLEGAANAAKLHRRQECEMVLKQAASRIASVHTVSWTREFYA